MHKRLLSILLFACVAIPLCFGQASYQSVSKRYPIRFAEEELPFPYESSHDLFTPNTSISRVLFVIHSSSYNPASYYESALKMLDKAPAQKDRTLVIAPLFLEAAQLQPDSKPDFLYWFIRPFWGSSRGYFDNHAVTISAFEVMDIIFSNLLKSGNFPNLKEIVITGHSAGGQMVNRYAVCNLFEEQTAKPKQIKIKYVVMAPSSYVYLSKERPVMGSSTKFAIPGNPDAGYNSWGYGLENCYSYHQRNNITPEWMASHYAEKNVIYLVGSGDNNEDDDSMGKSPSAMLQGPNRLARGQLYYNYLRHVYGDELKNRQYFRVVKDVGHYGAGLMQSPACMKFVFEY